MKYNPFTKLFLILATSSHAAASAILFPLYIYPFQDVPCGGWTDVIDTVKANPNLPFHLVINPDSGPGGLANSQPNSDWTGCIPQLKSANVKLFGYVHTTNGSQPQSAVNANVTTYAGWSASYRPHGIFFDESPVTAGANLTYMQALVGHARSLFGTSSPVILNPGRATDPGYYSFANLILSAENFYSAFSTSQLSFSTSTPASKQAVVLHHGPAVTDSNLVRELVSTDKIGAIFLTSQEYTTIPPDWNNFVNLVQADSQ
ncbi:hypothetical protein E1B28_012145 [Marasmius oreades]|uniref:Spherulin-4 n=1 Tax=Marasmius oreades TaxID=181124 RepID=A0A9P7RRQ2_9AGAR|nr:uncharacterized protein E1B28_012145 [Marasmius oreades]KAG7088120.1 hypothetical protein E1B28_012145 [Marasmius oreades]